MNKYPNSLTKKTYLSAKPYPVEHLKSLVMFYAKKLNQNVKVTHVIGVKIVNP